MDAYCNALQAHFSQAADPVTAESMAKYMRNQFEFLGLKTPALKRLQKEFLALHGAPDVADLVTLVPALWQLPAREYQYLALDFLQRAKKQLTPELAPLLEACILQKSWWDTIDAIAVHPVGALFERYPQEMAPYLEQWRSHGNFWLRRTTLLFQLSYKTRTDEALLFSLVRENLGSDEFFINKAIGWALREYSKTAADAVEHFVAETELSPLSRREALKWLEKKSI